MFFDNERNCNVPYWYDKSSINQVFLVQIHLNYMSVTRVMRHLRPLVVIIKKEDSMGPTNIQDLYDM